MPARRYSLFAVSLLATLMLVGGGATVAAGSVRAPVPASLKAAESSAEDIVDFALSGDRRSAVSAAASLQAAAGGPVGAALTRAGVPSAKVAQLWRRASRVVRLARGESFLAIALAANAVSQLMADLYARFQDRVPAAILTLDYLDREAQLRSLARQPDNVTLAVKELEPTWTRVRPRVVAAGGARAAAAFGRHVAAMKRIRPGAGKRMQAEAVRGLELVDRLEQVFLG
jgi:hypothetical protein